MRKNTSQLFSQYKKEWENCKSSTLVKWDRNQPQESHDVEERKSGPGMYTNKCTDYFLFIFGMFADLKVITMFSKFKKCGISCTYLCTSVHT